MKFKIIGITLILVIVLACGFTAFGEQTAPIDTTASVSSDTVDPVFKARLLNMLEHNRVYNTDFNDTDIIIDNSVVALFEKADQDGFVSCDVVNGFVYSMYGITTAGYTPKNSIAEKEGYIFIVPRGYDEYSHEITKVETDGDYIYVDSVLTVDAHDGLAYNLNCTTVFKVNGTSGFGYNIISSNYY